MFFLESTKCVREMQQSYYYCTLFIIRSVSSNFPMKIDYREGEKNENYDVIQTC